MAKIAIELSNGKIAYVSARNCEVARKHIEKRIAEKGLNLTVAYARVVSGRERY